MGREIQFVNPSFNEYWERWVSPEDLEMCPVCGEDEPADMNLDADGDCARCHGFGYIGTKEDLRLASVPSGAGYQLWETTNAHGSPLTPVFTTPNDLIDYLVETGDKWDGKRTRAHATELVNRAVKEALSR